MIPTMLTAARIVAFRLIALRLIAACLIALTPLAQAAKPDVFLLNTYDESKNVVGWVMSEKLDGVRGVWDGRQLVTRGGNKIHAPQWFVRGLPPFALDGELWSKRGDFENIVSIVRTHKPDARWRRIGYYIFEVPNQAGGLLERLAVLDAYLAERPSAHLHVIKQTPITRANQLRGFLREVTDGGGEGVVVRNPNTAYQTGRLTSALKVKNFFDDECEVRAHLPGKGKYRGQLGAVRCAWRDGRTVNIGSGFSDAERANPPPIGARITFKYYGLSRKGNPRFPVYLRIRPRDE